MHDLLQDPRALPLSFQRFTNPLQFLLVSQPKMLGFIYEGDARTQIPDSPTNLHQDNHFIFYGIPIFQGTKRQTYSSLVANSRSMRPQRVISTS
jgi:hypothetical protein